jgi:cytochrome d ubiquinol oxidase subunit II
VDFDITAVWAAIIFFSVFMYVVLDGFDLGIGMLFPFMPERRDRDIMMNSVAPIWDGNETWLVLGGEGLLAAFPAAYAVILPALYLPLIFMLIGLVFRGVAFEFRFKATDRERPVWDLAFAGGSVTAAFFQGVSLGAFLSGIPVSGRTYAGGALRRDDCLHPAGRDLAGDEVRGCAAGTDGAAGASGHLAAAGGVRGGQRLDPAVPAPGG